MVCGKSNQSINFNQFYIFGYFNSLAPCLSFWLSLLLLKYSPAIIFSLELFLLILCYFFKIYSKSAYFTKGAFNCLQCPVNFILLPFPGISVIFFSFISKKNWGKLHDDLSKNFLLLKHCKKFIHQWFLSLCSVLLYINVLN